MWDLPCSEVPAECRSSWESSPPRKRGFEWDLPNRQLGVSWGFPSPVFWDLPNLHTARFVGTSLGYPVGAS